MLSSADVPSAPRRRRAAVSASGEFVALDSFALRAQCGRDVRAPSEKESLI